MKEYDGRIISEDAKERFDDACFAMIMDGYAAKLGEEQLAENERLKQGDSLCYPEELDKKCLETIEKAFAKKRRGNRRAKIVRFAKRAVVTAASLILAVVLGSAVLYNTVEAFRLRIVDYAIEVLNIGEGTFISVKGNEKISGAELVPTWLPEGYRLVEENDSGEAHVVKYSDGTNSMRFISKEVSDTHAIDTENAEFETNVIIDEWDAVVTTKDGEVLLYWYDQEKSYTFSLWADNMDIETAIEIAESCYK